MRTAVALVIAGLCACRAADPPVAEEPLTPSLVAALPIRDLAGDAEAARALQDQIQQSLEDRGLRFVPRSELDRVLEAHRIRYTDSVSDDAMRAIAEDTGSGTILLGSLLAYDPGEPPRVALALRRLDVNDRRRSRSILVALDGDDFEQLMQLGAITNMEELQDEAVARVVEGLTGQADSGPAPEADDPLLYLYTRDSFDPSQLDRIVLLPPTNRTTLPWAAEILMEVLADEWRHAFGGAVVERSELLAAIVKERLTSMRLLSPEVLARIGRRVGARYFAQPSLNLYRERVNVGNWILPEVELAVHVLDADTGEIVAAAAVRRRGDAGHFILGYGLVTDPVQLTRRAVREVIAGIGGLL